MGFEAATLQVFSNTNHIIVSSPISFPNKENWKDLKYEISLLIGRVKSNQGNKSSSSLQWRVMFYFSYLTINFDAFLSFYLTLRTDSPQLQFWLLEISGSDRGKKTERGGWGEDKIQSLTLVELSSPELPYHSYWVFISCLLKLHILQDKV